MRRHLALTRNDKDMIEVLDEPENSIHQSVTPFPDVVDDVKSLCVIYTASSKSVTICDTNVSYCRQTLSGKVLPVLHPSLDRGLLQ